MQCLGGKSFSSFRKTTIMPSSKDPPVCSAQGLFLISSTPSPPLLLISFSGNDLVASALLYRFRGHRLLLLVSPSRGEMTSNRTAAQSSRGIGATWTCHFLAQHALSESAPIVSLQNGLVFLFLFFFLERIDPARPESNSASIY